MTTVKTMAEISSEQKGSEQTASEHKVSEYVVLGRINGLYGVRGWVKIYSHTEPRENILSYTPLYVKLKDGWTPLERLAGKRHGKGVVAQFAAYEDRDLAATLVGADIAVRREQLPAVAEDEFYWHELVGLQVLTLEGQALGVVDHLLETGANDVLVVKQGNDERLIPYIPGEVVTDIDLDTAVMRVDWDPEF
jgi:16S rRNA processing protein RimM